MPYPSLLHPEPLSLQQSTVDPYLHKEMLKHSSISLCGVYGSWCTQDLFEPSERLWWEWGFIINVNSPLLPSCWKNLIKTFRAGMALMRVTRMGVLGPKVTQGTNKLLVGFR